MVARGKLLIVLDDVEARARVAAAESGVKAAQAQLDAVTHNGTQAERQASAAEIAQDRLTLDQAQHNLDALARLQSTGAAAPDEVAAAQQRLASAQASLNAAQQTSQSRYSPDEIARAQAALADAEAALAAAQQVEAQTRYAAPIKGTVYTLDAAHSEFVEQGKLLLQMADLKHERVRAYFDEPDLGRLARGPDRRSSAGTPNPARSGTAISSGCRLRSLPTPRAMWARCWSPSTSPRDGLLPDTNVTVQVTTSSQPNALSIPREALHSENGQYYVYKIVDS